MIAKILGYNATAAIPVKSNSKSSNENMEWYLYRCRNLVENALARLKRFRRISTRYNKLKVSYEAAIIIACT